MVKGTVKGKVRSPKISRPNTPKISRTPRAKPTIKTKGTSVNLGRNRPRPKQRVRQQKKAPTPKKSATTSNYLRQKAVKLAWKREQALVNAGGGTRKWTKWQRDRISKAGKLKGYEGHHIRSVNGHTKKWAGDPRNIKFVTRREHLREHSGSFKNKTTGKLIDRQKLLRVQKNKAARRVTKK